MFYFNVKQMRIKTFQISFFTEQQKAIKKAMKTLDFYCPAIKHTTKYAIEMCS